MQAATAPTGPYEGKAKRVTLRPDGLVELRYKDDATAFNGQKHALFADKGVLNSQISEMLFQYMEEHGIPTHSRGRLDERTLLAVPAKMFALEAVVRFKIAGSLRKRTGLPDGTPCSPPIVEFYYKRDDLGDPLLNDAHIALLKLATPGPYTFILEASKEVPRRVSHPSRKTIGLRVPEHTVLQALLALYGAALLATTLIAPGETEPMNDANAIRERFEKVIAGVIDAGACALEPTTVVDLTDTEPQLIRQGRGDLARLGL